MFGGVGSGIALAGLLCLLFLAAGWTADQAWLALGAIALLPTLFTWRTWRHAKERSPAAPTETAASLRSPARQRMIWAYGSFGFGYIVPATFLPAMARDVVANPMVFGWAWPVFGAAALASVLLAGRLSARYSYRRIWLFSHWVMATGILVPIVWKGIGGIVVSALLVGGTFVVATMAGLQDGRRVAGTSATRLLAAMTAAFAIGQVIGPLLVSATAGYAWGMDFTLGVAAAAVVAGAIALRDAQGNAAQGKG
jgi:predicted MFS family arabinose efflux permease